MPVPAGHWLILMSISQLKLNRSEVIMGLQMQEFNVIKDASCCRLQRKCLFYSFLNVFVVLSFSVLLCCLFFMYVSIACLNVFQGLSIMDKIFCIFLLFIPLLSSSCVSTSEAICLSIRTGSILCTIKELQHQK